MKHETIVEVERQLPKLEEHPLAKDLSALERFMLVRDGWMPMPVPTWLSREMAKHQRDIEYGKVAINGKKSFQLFRIKR